MKQDVTRLTNERLMKKEIVMKDILNSLAANNPKNDTPDPGDCCTVPPGGGSGDPGPGGPTT
jgi:hypothetical protein